MNDKELRSKVMSDLAKERWKKTTKEERIEFSKKLNTAKKAKRERDNQK